MGTVVVDADVIIGFLDASDAQHRRAIEVLKAWLSAGDVVLIPASVYAEILVWPLRRGVDGTVDAFIAESGLRVVPLTADIARQAANLRAKHASLRLPDALVLATAVTHGASFLSLDHSLQRIVDDLSSRA
jgi:predicted nucleic acid-binding protein